MSGLEAVENVLEVWFSQSLALRVDIDHDDKHVDEADDQRYKKHLVALFGQLLAGDYVVSDEQLENHHRQGFEEELHDSTLLG